MFDNIGSKIKTVAKVFTWIGIILSSIIGLVVIFTNEDAPLSGVLIILIGCLSSWLSSLTLYGFGQLIENSDIMVEQGRKQLSNKSSSSSSNSTVRHTESHTVEKQNTISFKHRWRCPNCGNMISEEVCPFCNNKGNDNLVLSVFP